MTSHTDKSLREFYLTIDSLWNKYANDYEDDQTTSPKDHITKVYADFLNKSSLSQDYINESRTIINTVINAKSNQPNAPYNPVCKKCTNHFYCVCKPDFRITPPANSHFKFLYDLYNEREVQLGLRVQAELGLISYELFQNVVLGISIFYLIQQNLDELERIIHNEGRLLAAGSMLSALLGGIGGAALGSFIVAPALFGLAVMAGLPVGPLGVIIASAIVFAFVGATVMQTLCNSTRITKGFSLFCNDKMDPHDPYRFRLTNEEEKKLKDNGFNIIVVKCAMVALRKSMNCTNVPSFIDRHATKRGAQIQEKLELLRNIRRGETEDSIVIDGMTFNLKDELALGNNSAELLN